MSDKPDFNLKPLAATSGVTREDFELACVREFAHSGLRLGVGVSREERRERIRAAILRENKAHLRWRNSAFTYADIYAHVYRRSLGSSDTHDEDALLVASRYYKPTIEDEFADDEEAFEGDEEIFA